jgi:hypothetical protein
VHLGGGVVHGDAARKLLLLLLGVVGRQVGRDAFPRLAAVARAEEVLRAEVERALLRRAQVDGRVPVEAQLLLFVTGERLDVARLVGLAVNAPDVAALRLGVDVVGVFGVGEHPEAVAAVHVLPLRVADAAGVGRVADPGRVVLQPAVDAEGSLHVHAHVVELRDGQVLRFPPAVAAVVGVPESAVVADDEVVCVVGVDPEVVEVAVRAARDVREALAAIVAHDEREVRLVNLVLVLRVDDEVGEVEGSPDHVLAAVELCPRLAAVVRAIEPVLRDDRLDGGVDDVRF